MNAVEAYLAILRQRGWDYSLDAPASAADLSAFCEQHRIQLPDAFCELYQSLNGQKMQRLPADEPRWLSLREIPQVQQDWRDFLARTFGEPWRLLHWETREALLVQPYFYRDAWLPFMKESDGSLYCLDFAPAAGGQVGQVLYIRMQRNIHEYDVVYEAPDFATWLSEVVATYQDVETPNAARLCSDYFHLLWQADAPLNPPVRPAVWAWLQQQYPDIPHAMQQLYHLFDGFDARGKALPWRWLAVLEMQAVQQSWQHAILELDDSGRLQALPQSWLPFLQQEHCDYALDFAPSAEGRVAQIIRLEREGEALRVSYLEEDFETFLSEWLGEEDWEA